MHCRPTRRYRCLDKKTKRSTTANERRQRIQLTLLEFGQNHQIIFSSDENEKSQQDLDSLAKNLVNEKVRLDHNKRNSQRKKNLISVKNSESSRSFSSQSTARYSP